MLKNMKNKIYALALSLLMLMVACDNSEDLVKSGIAKEWKLVSVNDVKPEFTVYMRFDGGIFSIYQQLYTLDYLYYDGSYSLNDGILSGEYFDGSAWKCSYTLSLSNDGKRLRLISNEEYPITNIYEVCTIPQSVIEEVSTRSHTEIDYHL